MLQVNAFALAEDRYLFSDLFIDDDHDLVYISTVYPDIELEHEAVECRLPNGRVYKFTVTANCWWHEAAVACKLEHPEVRAFVRSAVGPVEIDITYAGASRTYQLGKPTPGPRQNLSLFTLFKHDHYLLPVWLDHYRTIGVEHFYLYYNGNQDELDKFSFQARDVTFCAWDYPYEIEYSTLRNESLRHNIRSAQTMAMNSCLYRAKRRTTWMAYFDLDEFLVIDDLQNYLSGVPRAQTSHLTFRNRWADMPGYDYLHVEPESFYQADIVCSEEALPLYQQAKMIVNTENVALCKLHQIKPHCQLNNSVEYACEHFFLHFYRYSGQNRSSPIVDPVHLDPWTSRHVGQNNRHS